MKMDMKFAKVFEPLLTTEALEIDLFSGRAGGKSFATADLVILYMLKYPHNDVMMSRCNAVSLKTSVYAEMVSRIDQYGLKGFKCTVSPCQIRTKTNTIYFTGIGGSDTGRTRSFKSVNPLSLIVVDEIQQLASRETMEHALSSFRRHLDENINSHIVLAGNPPDFAPGTDKGWWWDYLDEQEQNPSALVIRSTYKDIAGLLSKSFLESIEFQKKINNKLYLKLYMGEFDASDTIAVYMFRKNLHMLKEFPKDQIIVEIVLGVDVGVINDATSACPIAITDKGYLILLPSYRHDPKISGVKSQRDQAREIRQFTGELFQKYDFNSYYRPFCSTVDCAAPEMVLALRDNGIKSYAFTDKNTQGRIEANNNYFGSNQLYMIEDVNNNILAKELLSNTFINMKLDNKIANDAFDAFQYGLYYIFRTRKFAYKQLKSLRGEQDDR